MTSASPSSAAHADAVVRALSVPPTAVHVVRTQRELVPRQAGFYAWWARRGAIEGVPRQPHPLDDNLDLFYVGISPRRASSQQKIYKRVLGHHLGGNTGSSTFRFALASLLLDELQLTPTIRGDKTVLSYEDNCHLSDWQTDNLRLTWCMRARPWEIEDEVIALMQPPLNCAANALHPFYRRVRDARAEFRRRADG
jgi:hypothetical protein